MLLGNHIKAEHLSEFQISNDIHYHNHAAVSPWPVMTANAIKQFADDNDKNQIVALFWQLSLLVYFVSASGTPSLVH